MYWWRRIFQKERTERQLDSELRFHLEQRTAELAESGLPVDEARRRAQLEFGGTEAIKEECRESRRAHLIDTFLQDVRYALRTMRRTPGFTAVAIITLALGIGANTAIFSVFNGVLLNPLPFPHAEQLVALYESKPHFEKGSIPYLNLVDWKNNNHTFSAIAGYRAEGYSITGTGEPEFVDAERASAELFPILGIPPTAGRLFTEDEDRVGAAPVALITEGLWKRKFASAPAVIGSNVTLDGHSYQIIGVIPALHLPIQNFNRKAEIFTLLGQWDMPENQNRSYGLGIDGIGRLKPDVKLEAARADMGAVTHALAAAYPKANAGTGATVVSLKEQMIGNIRPYLVLLMGAVAFVLLIACLNVGNLLLARSTARRRELAVRTALGAPRARIVRQLLTESILLALAGGALGVGAAAWLTKAGVHVLPRYFPRIENIQQDWHVLIFASLVSICSGVVFGLLPALRGANLAVQETLKDSDRGTSRSSHRTNGVFVAVETGTALVLLIGAGLMLRSMQQLWRVDPGFNPGNVIKFGVVIPSLMTGTDASVSRAALRQFHQQVKAFPGIEAASFSWGAVPFGGDDEEQFWIDGHPRPANDNDLNWTLEYVVEPDYFTALKIPLKRGRLFSDNDDEHAPRVVVVDEKFAQKFFPGQDPVGRYINLSTMDRRCQIVGVVGHIYQWGLEREAKESLQVQLYLPYMQLADKFLLMANTGTGMFMRTRTSPEYTYESLRHELAGSSSSDILFGPQTMEASISDSIAESRLSMILLGAFACVAVLLAGVGIYGVISYIVGQRTREIGIRMALGARRSQVMAMVITQGAKMTLAGIVAGLLAAFALSRVMSALLFQVSPTDPLTFAAVAVLLLMIALWACYLPARRATRVDPTIALRCE